MSWFEAFWNSDALWAFYKTILQVIPYIIIMILTGGLSFKFGKSRAKNDKTDETISQLNEKIERLENSQRSQMRDIITKLWQTVMKRKNRFIAPEELDLLKSCYRDYVNHNGNTYIAQLYQDLLLVPVKSPKNCALPKGAQEWRKAHEDELKK